MPFGPIKSRGPSKDVQDARYHRSKRTFSPQEGTGLSGALLLVYNQWMPTRTCTGCKIRQPETFFKVALGIHEWCARCRKKLGLEEKSEGEDDKFVPRFVGRFIPREDEDY